MHRQRAYLGSRNIHTPPLPARCCRPPCAPSGAAAGPPQTPPPALAAPVQALAPTTRVHSSTVLPLIMRLQALRKHSTCAGSAPVDHSYHDRALEHGAAVRCARLLVRLQALRERLHLRGQRAPDQAHAPSTRVHSSTVLLPTVARFPVAFWSAGRKHWQARRATPRPAHGDPHLPWLQNALQVDPLQGGGDGQAAGALPLNPDPTPQRTSCGRRMRSK